MVFISCVIFTMIIPVCLLVLGTRCKFFPPKNRYCIIGYRFESAMRTKETWAFAQKYYGNYCFYFGVALMILSLITLFVLKNASDVVFGIMVIVLSVLQITGIVLPVAKTEKTLKARRYAQSKKDQ